MLSIRSPLKRRAPPSTISPNKVYSPDYKKVKNSTIQCVVRLISATLPGEEEPIVVAIVMTNYKDSILHKISGKLIPLTFEPLLI